MGVYRGVLSNPDFISDQKMSFFTPVFRPVEHADNFSGPKSCFLFAVFKFQLISEAKLTDV